MASVDITSLYTNIPLDETISICSNELFDEKQNVSNLDRASFEKLLRFATKDPIFIFDKNFYKQLDGVAMGSFANAFLCNHEKRWLDKCPEQFKPVFYRQYVDDIFVLFRKEEQLKLFLNYAYIYTNGKTLKGRRECVFRGKVKKDRLLSARN